MFANAFADYLQHYVQLAQQRHWWACVEQQVKRMDAGPSGLFAGLEQAWREQLAAIGFEPHPDERGEWWKVTSEAERHPWRPARKEWRPR